MPTRNFAAVMFVMMLALVFVHLAGGTKAKVDKIPFKPRFTTYLAEGRVAKVTVLNNGMGGHFLDVEMKDTDADGAPMRYKVDVVLTDDLVKRLEAGVPTYEFDAKSTVMRDMLWSVVPFLAVLALLIVFVFPPSITATAPAAGGPMTVGIAAEPTGLDPALYDFTDNRLLVTTQVMETLVSYAPDTPLVRVLAESWSVSPDGLVWTFIVRSGVTFHDGTPLDAAAVAFNFQRQWDPAHPYHNGAFDYFGLVFGGFKGDPNCLITGIVPASST
jgi:hypothetical protein